MILLLSDHPSIQRIADHLQKISRPETHRAQRVVLWRGIVDVALQAHAREVREWDALNAVVVDEAFMPTGGVVE